MSFNFTQAEENLREFITAVANKRNVEVPLDLNINDPNSRASIQVNYNLMAEEDKELLEELDYFLDDPNNASKLAVLKELIDKLYVTIHFAVSFGFNLQPAWDAVHKNNMQKITNGTIREDGKLIKPPDHKKPDLSEFV